MAKWAKLGQFNGYKTKVEMKQAKKGCFYK